MPPRYSYWTIIIDNQPTAFRAALHEDLLPTFNRLKQKHPTAVMMWFQRGRLWPSRQDAQAAFVAERRDTNRRPKSWPRDDRPTRADDRPPRRDDRGRPPRQDDRGRPAWPADRSRTRQSDRGRPQGGREDGRGRGWSSTGPGASGRRPPKPGDRGGPPGGKPSEGGPPRDRKWRPGGEHRDPRQKFRDAKKARWARFKQRIRQPFDRRNPRKKKDDDEQ